MLTLVAFAVALGLLIAVHEYGHYRVAVACGVRVIRFGVLTFPLGDDDQPPTSFIGRFFHVISRPVVRWKPRRPRAGQDTEFAIGLFPFGGYVQMLGHGGHDPIPAGLEAQAFRNKPLWQRFAIVAAGPVANLLLAMLLYSSVNWYGMQEAKAVLASPVAGSVAQAAGLRGGEAVRSAGFVDGEQNDVRSFEDLRWLLTRGALDGRDVRLVFDAGTGPREAVLRLSGIDASEADARLYRTIGILGPWTEPLIGEVTAASVAEKAGLRKGDLVRSIGGQPVMDGTRLRDAIRGSVDAGKALTLEWQIERNGRLQSLMVTPELRQDQGVAIGRIGAYIGAPPAFVQVRYGLFEGLRNGAIRTWEVSVLTLRMMGRMLIGEASLKNLSGPLTIADYAGKSASMGLTQYIVFLALISVSLGVLNLLPLPVLDGGHLMYYLWEGVTGKGVSDAWMERLQRGGVALLLVMMSIALFNDVTRLFG